MRVPNVETLGYCQPSLRDENKIAPASFLLRSLVNPGAQEANLLGSQWFGRWAKTAATRTTGRARPRGTSGRSSGTTGALFGAGARRRTSGSAAAAFAARTTLWRHRSII